MSTLVALSVCDSEFDSIMQRMWQDLLHHMTEEEELLFPQVEQMASGGELLQMAKRWKELQFDETEKNKRNDTNENKRQTTKATKRQANPEVEQEEIDETTREW